MLKVFLIIAIGVVFLIGQYFSLPVVISIADINIYTYTSVLLLLLVLFILIGMLINRLFSFIINYRNNLSYFFNKIKLANNPAIFNDALHYLFDGRNDNAVTCLKKLGSYNNRDFIYALQAYALYKDNRLHEARALMIYMSNKQDIVELMDSKIAYNNQNYLHAVSIANDFLKRNSSFYWPYYIIAKSYIASSLFAELDQFAFNKKAFSDFNLVKCHIKCELTRDFLIKHDYTNALIQAKQAYSWSDCAISAWLLAKTMCYENVKKALPAIKKAWFKYPIMTWAVEILNNDNFSNEDKMQYVSDIVNNNKNDLNSLFLLVRIAKQTNQLDSIKSDLQTLIGLSSDNPLLSLLLNDMIEINKNVIDLDSNFNPDVQAEQNDSQLCDNNNKDNTEILSIALSTFDKLISNNLVWQCSFCKNISYDWHMLCSSCDNISTIDWQHGNNKYFYE